MTGNRALIGSLEHIEAMLEGEAGTEIRSDAVGPVSISQLQGALSP